MPVITEELWITEIFVVDNLYEVDKLVNFWAWLGFCFRPQAQKTVDCEYNLILIVKLSQVCTLLSTIYLVFVPSFEEKIVQFKFVVIEHVITIYIGICGSFCPRFVRV